MAGSVNQDWVRAMTRTAEISPTATRTLAAVVAERAATDGARPALVGEGASLTYAELAARAQAYARWGRDQGLLKGDRVALILRNQPDYVAIWLGLSSIGVVTALLNTQLAGDGLRHCLALTGARRIIAGAEFCAGLDDLGLDAPGWSHGDDHPGWRRLDTTIDARSSAPAPAAADVTLGDPALLIYTSGTTGLPKAAHVSHYRIMMWSEWFAGVADAGPDDRLYDCLPMYHSVGGVVAVGAMLAAGGAVIVREGFSARRFWADIAASRATIFQYIGELCRYLLAAPADAAVTGHQLRLCVGNGLRGDVWEPFADRFAIPRIIEFYAATEGSFSLFNLEGRPGAIGRIPRFMAHRSPVALVRFDHGAEAPVRGADGFCRRCAPGEIGEAIGRIAKDPADLATRFEGYTDPEASRRKVLRHVFAPDDAWFRTGDLMRQDAAGFFYFVDRIGDTFRWKGENVATSEVADAVGACPGVVEATVYGVSVPGADGRAGMAAIVPGAAFDLATLHAHLAARLPPYARPVFLRLHQAMAVTSTFKVQKGDLMREGFDPGLVTDRLFVDDGGFVPVDAACHARIVTGAMRL